MNLILHERWTVERFLDWEDQQEGKHEFDGTQIIEMTGGSRAHQRIVHNLTALLLDSVNASQFDVLQEMRIRIQPGKIRVPDVAIVRAPVPNTQKTLDDAVMLFEVLSVDTAHTDQGVKRDDYLRLPSMRRYVMLEQDRVAATVLERVGSGWKAASVSGGVLNLPEAGASIPLSWIYRGLGLASDIQGESGPVKNPP